MSRIVLRTEINAPVERCFDLSRSIELHQHSTARTQEKAIAGKTQGLISLNETVTWRARHFGIWQELTSKITEYNRPHSFTDEMVKGVFKSIRHVHEFNRSGDRTIMTDIFEFESPLGILGWLADKIILINYLKKFLQERNELIVRHAESESWKQFIKS